MRCRTWMGVGAVLSACVCGSTRADVVLLVSGLESNAVCDFASDGSPLGIFEDPVREAAVSPVLAA